MNSVPAMVLCIICSICLIGNSACQKQNEEVTFWVGGAPQEIVLWETLVAKFNQTSGKQVQLVRQPTYSDQRLQSLLISLYSRQPNPDIFLMDIIWLDLFIESGWLEPLNGFIKKHAFDTTCFFNSIVAPVDKRNACWFAFPVFVDIGLLYYRKDLLGKYGYQHPPETWREMLDMARHIQLKEQKKNRGFQGYVWQGAQYEGLVCTFLEFATSFGGGFIKDGQFNFENQSNIEALTFMQDLIHKYRVSPVNTYTNMKEEDVRRSFQHGSALFERNWLYAWPHHQSDQSRVKGKTGIALLPHAENQPLAATLGGWHIGISRTSDKKDDAWAFLQFVLSYAVQKELFIKMGRFSGRQDIYHDSEILSRIPHLKVIQAAMASAAPRPQLPFYMIVSDIIQRHANRCLAGKTTARQSLRAMDKEIEKINRIYGKK